MPWPTCLLLVEFEAASAGPRLHSPGLREGRARYPVFYLLHGASDSDDSWSTVGRAGFILDNLIAAGKAKPMVVVMPAGHTGPFRFGGPRPPGPERPVDEFGDDFAKDLKPYVEANYRTLADREHRAIAGLSMGGVQTLNLAFGHPDDFAYVGVFSSGVFGIAGGRNGAPEQPVGGAAQVGAGRFRPAEGPAAGLVRLR